MDRQNHPCFSEGARHRVGRIHLPVAPKCNMQCNYCNRDFACVNESRPGVSSAILSPHAAVAYLDAVLDKVKNIEVVGIAGPGDPFANSDETLETLGLVREKYPDMMLCVATNGLEASAHADALASLAVSHVTITINAVDPEIGKKIYAWARTGRKIYRGIDAARVILERQLDAVSALKARGMTVKINTVVIPGINDGHVSDIAKRVSALGADILNCIPLYHVAGTPFETIAPIAAEPMRSIREQARAYLPQMSHCGRCRADAVGLIGEAQNEKILALMKEVTRPRPTAERPYVAVASMEGLLVNQHLGEATSLWIFGEKEGKADLVERRFTPEPGGGEERWAELAHSISDCGTLLVSGIGPLPQAAVERAGVRVVVMEGMVAEAVEAILHGREIPKMLLRTPGRCGIGKQCTGNGMGCG